MKKISFRVRTSEEPDLGGQMKETAERLVHIAIEAFMRMRGVGRETATKWIVRAAVAAEEKEPTSKSS